PARNEAATIAASIGALLEQEYRGAWTIILVDDDSTDGTGDLARRVASASGPAGRLQVIESRVLPAGWTGKLWAVRQGIDAALAARASSGKNGGGEEQEPGGAQALLHGERPDYLLLTDADIVHAPESLQRLVGHAERNRLVLVSLMAKL